MTRVVPIVRFVILALLPLPASAAAQIILGAGPGTSPYVRVVDPDPDVGGTFFAYHPNFPGGVRVAFGELNGDGILDIITAPGPGGAPHIIARSGSDLSVLASFFAYDPSFTGGVSVAAGDVNGDGVDDIITAPGPGAGPHVIVFSGTNLSYLASFFAFNPAFAGGVSVAAGDVNGDGLADIITGAGTGGGPHVIVRNGADLSYIASFFPYDPAFTGGVAVAAGDMNDDGKADIVTAPGPGGAPHVIVFSGSDLSYLAKFFVYEPSFAGGISVAMGDWNRDGVMDIIAGRGRDSDDPVIKVISGYDLTELLSDFVAFNTGFNHARSVSVGSYVDLHFTSVKTTSFCVCFGHSSFNVFATGPGSPTISVSGTLPAGVTFNNRGNGSAELVWDSQPGSNGIYPLTLTATSGAAAPVTQTLTLTIAEPPRFTSAEEATFTVGAPGSFTVTTTGFPVAVVGQGPPASLPAGVTFVDQGNGTGLLSGTPAPGTAGIYWMHFAAENGAGYGSPYQVFILTVTE